MTPTTQLTITVTTILPITHTVNTVLLPLIRAIPLFTITATITTITATLTHTLTPAHITTIRITTIPTAITIPTQSVLLMVPELVSRLE